jgi:hypothetical protein
VEEFAQLEVGCGVREAVEQRIFARRAVIASGAKQS